MTPQELIDNTITIRELIEALRRLDQDAKIALIKDGAILTVGKPEVGLYRDTVTDFGTYSFLGIDLNLVERRNMDTEE